MEFEVVSLSDGSVEVEFWAVAMALVKEIIENASNTVMKIASIVCLRKFRPSGYCLRIAGWKQSGSNKLR